MYLAIKYASGNIFLIIQQFLFYDIDLQRVLDKLESIVVILLNVKYCLLHIKSRPDSFEGLLYCSAMLK